MRTFTLLVSGLALTGCAAPLTIPDLGDLYTRAAREHQLERNPVIVIPGILGTRLEEPATGQTVWGAFGGGAADPATSAGAQLIALPMREAAPLSELTDQVQPTAVLDVARVSLLGLPFELSAYAQILATLGAGGYRDQMLAASRAVDYGEDHYTCFQFAYDWRRDNIENAQRLAQFIEQRRAEVQAKIQQRYGIPQYDVKFDIVAHSMGGLIARWFLQHGAADLPPAGLPVVDWAGAEHVERVLIVGTPNAGSVKSLLNLTDGARFGLVHYDPLILGTMPSIYQLLPRPRHHAVATAADQPLSDWMSAGVWEQHGWGLAGASDEALARLLPDATPDARRRIALDHLRKCLRRAERFFAALDQPSALPAGLELHLFAGDATPTPARLKLDRGGKPKLDRPAPGDGTVTRSSALLDERLDGEWRPWLRSPIPWTSVRFLFADHLGLTRDPGFSDNVLSLLLETPRRR